MSEFDGEFDLELCKRRCANSMRNTAVGKWLARAINEIARLRAIINPESVNGIEMILAAKDPAMWAAAKLLKADSPAKTSGEAVEAIRAVFSKALELAEKNRIVLCPGCSKALYGDARRDGMCVDCGDVLASARKRMKIACPECNAEAVGGSVHNRPDGTLCVYVYGRRGWRQLGEYDT